MKKVKYLILKFFFMDIIIDFCEWSKRAEWISGTKQMFIQNNWKEYFSEYTRSK